MDPEKFEYFETLFHPKSIAIIGVSEGSIFYLFAPMVTGFKGKVYAVNPNRDSIFNIKCYKSVLDINDDIDFATVTVPAKYTPDVMRECVEKGIKTVHFFTSGYSETGTEEGKKLEQELLNISRKGNTKIIGPNCMGVYCPESGLSFMPGFPKQAGPVAFIAQSGALTEQVVYSGRLRGIGFSKVVSYGNAIDLDNPDFIEYLAEDPKTRIISTYIEGTKNGRRLLETLKEAVKKKPVIVWKGGQTERGAVAVSSHTGSLAGSGNIWRAALNQIGALSIRDLEELIDTFLVFLNNPYPRGRRGLIVSFSGGESVSETDKAVEMGLEIPLLSKETKEKIEQMVPAAGISARNPLDIPSAFFRFANIAEVVKLAAAEDNIDFVIFEMLDRFRSVGKRFRGFQWYVDLRKSIRDAANYIKNELGKPFVITMLPAFSEHEAIFLRKFYGARGISVVPTMTRAARAIKRMIDYQEFLNRQKSQ
ncbi:MAG: acetate--CoA ligase family protein [Candidatus Jordarchaeum sp.]|uniref:acetate--CoA ligase family protein n=1 Tax=Candidatus Jordarchaeum sp. TaxID=2823881 RepID=UPI00404A0DE8